MCGDLAVCVVYCDGKCGMVCAVLWCVVDVMWSVGDGRCGCAVCSGVWCSVCCALWCCVVCYSNGVIVCVYLCVCVCVCLCVNFVGCCVQSGVYIVGS